MSQYYQLGDRPSLAERRRFDIPSDKANLPGDHIGNRRYLRAIRTSEFRAPRKDERYLSGAVPMAYRAPNDLTSAYRIMELVVVAKEERWVISA